ncbi:SMI1/KNR4 family protein [Psychroserpens sp. MEBiC05023]
MIIEYLKSMKNNPKPNKGLSEMRGLTLERIIELELELNQGNPFPKVYREYLYLGGEFNALGLQTLADGDNGGDILISHNYVNSFLAKNRINTLERPYVVLHLYDDNGFIFCYTDEGDNPKTYIFEPYNDFNKLNPSIEPVRNKPNLKEFIDKQVDLALKGLQSF